MIVHFENMIKQIIQLSHSQRKTEKLLLTRVSIIIAGTLTSTPTLSWWWGWGSIVIVFWWWWWRSSALS